MSDIRIASRYAKSLMELANEKDATNAVFADVEGFAQACAQSKELMNLLKSPVIHADKKKQVLKAAFPGFNAITSLFVDAVVRKGRESFLPLIAKESIRLYNERNNIVSAVVTSAVPLNDVFMNEIKSNLEAKTGKTVNLIAEVNPELIGGIVVRIGDRLFDASIANQLKKIKKQLVLN